MILSKFSQLILNSRLLPTAIKGDVSNALKAKILSAVYSVLT